MPVKLTPKQEAMIWMNKTFGSDIDKAIKGTPISKNLIIAIGIQETFYLWASKYRTSSVEDVLALCVGDTIDFPKRSSAWPRNRKELEKHPRGKEMFKIARKALETVATVNSGYAAALKDPDKFCHGFGMFQYDIQYFEKEDPDFFLKEKWTTWSSTLGKGIKELKSKIAELYGANKKSLTYDESVYVAIAYNRGSTKTKRDMAKHKFKQGYKDKQGVFYGEHIDANLKAVKGLW